MLHILVVLYFTNYHYQMFTKIIVLAVFVGSASLAAIAQPVTITFLNEKKFKSSSNEWQFDADKEATSFTPDAAASSAVYIRMNFTDPKAITAKYRLSLVVYKQTSGGEEYAYSQELGIPKKPGFVMLKSNFTEGKYVARVIDKEHESTVYGTANFSVSAATTPDYKHNNTFVACKSVNDDWNAVGETKKISAGSCIQFLYKAKDKINHYFVVWAIRYIKNDGGEEYVNDLLQNVGDDPWRYVATNDVCEFSKAGKYRVYLLDKAESDSMHGSIGDTYFGKMEFMVE